jgi:hypothetical protein
VTTPSPSMLRAGLTCRCPSHRIRPHGLGCDRSLPRWAHEAHSGRQWPGWRRAVVIANPQS